MVEKTYKSGFILILAALGLIIGCLIVWEAMDIFLLAFSAILFSIFLSTIASWIHQKFHISYVLSLLLVFILFIGLFTFIFWVFSPIINQQLKELINTLPTAFSQLKATASKFINIDFISGKITNELFVKNDKLFSQITNIFSLTIGGIVFIVLFFIVGIYLAYNPKQYVIDFLKIIPPSKRDFARRLLAEMTAALRFWLLGKILAMLTVGIMTYLGLTILNVPLAFILGLLAACLTFVPYIGPILASLPAILIGLTQSPIQAFNVIVVYIVIHIIEGYLITPVIDQKTVSLPPALTVMMQVLLGFLVGFMGIVLASPLTVILFVLLEHLYQKKPKKLESFN